MLTNVNHCLVKHATLIINLKVFHICDLDACLEKSLVVALECQDQEIKTKFLSTVNPIQLEIGKNAETSNMN